MRHYYSADAIRAAEAPLLASLPEGALMRRAAFGLATAIARELALLTGGVAGRRICAVVGSGDNGGDALWAATFLRRRGAAAAAVLLNPDRTHKAALAAFTRAGGAVVQSIPAATDLVIDGVVGISGSGPLRPNAAEVFAGVAAPVVAVDIPSGIDVQTGAAEEPHVHAALTVTFGGLKPVHALGDCGRVELVDIGLDLPPSDMLGFEAADVVARWPVPGATDDKYTQGVTGILAGSATYPGAAILCTGAAVAATSGMVRYAGSAAAEVVSHWPEVVAAPSVSAAGRVQSWVVGPGLGTDDTGAAALWFALETDLPVIVDADGLTILAAHPDLVANRNAPTVLTPHAGEFARLAGSPPGPDRVDATRRLADQLGVTVLLKGNVTVIAEPGGPVYLNRAGQSWAATAGSGDVLSGIIGALLAAGLPAGEAAAAAAFVHARAANLSAADPGPHPAPTSASRILAHVRAAIAISLTEGLAMSRKRTHGPQIAPAYTGRLAMAPVPSLRMPDEAMDPDAAYRFIHDELMLDGSSRLNLATFVTTWMDPQAEKLMAETFDKNMIDKDEYPATAAIEQRCVCMVADLFHAEDLRDDDPISAVGVSTIGSSEAVMLAGLALKWRWREKVGKDWQRAHAESGDGLQRAGGVGEVLPLLRRRAAVSADGGGPLRHHARAGAGQHRRGHHRRGGDPRHHLHRRTGTDRRDLRRARQAGRRRGTGHPRARRRGQRRLRGAVPASRPGVGLPAAARGVDQRQRAQVRPDVSGHRIRGVAQQGVPARRSGLPGQLPGRRHADLHAQLLPARQPGGRPVLQLPAARPRRLRAGDALPVADRALAGRPSCGRASISR